LIYEAGLWCRLAPAATVTAPIEINSSPILRATLVRLLGAYLRRPAIPQPDHKIVGASFGTVHPYLLR